MVFHTIAQSIRRHPAARQELIAHALRGPTYAALFVLVPNCVMQGAWFWALVSLLAFDLAISLWDFAIEGKSRAFFGGLPTGEYVLHVLIAMVFGALITAVLFEAAPWASAATRFAWEPAPVPAALRWIFLPMAALVLASGILDLRATLRLGRRSIATGEGRDRLLPDVSSPREIGTSP
jgi:hypothetical protein